MKVIKKRTGHEPGDGVERKDKGAKMSSLRLMEGLHSYDLSGKMETPVETFELPSHHLRNMTVLMHDVS